LGFGKSACYVQSKQLAEQGYLAATQVPGQRQQPVTLYRLTESGRRKVERWLRTAAQAPPIDSEAFLRIHAGHFATAEGVLYGLRLMRPELTQRLAMVDKAEARLAYRIPPPCEQLELELIRSLLTTYLRWLARAEKALTREIRINNQATVPTPWGG
jgi:DNA-binding PadR family transcriptional regulator